ncbi:MAG: DUF5336 domain-containing protein, partial [Mycobacterium sp.]
QSYSQPGQPPQQPPAPAAPATPTEPGESNLPQILTIVVAVLGLATYLAGFAPLIALPEELAEFGDLATIGVPVGWDVVLALLAGLVAGVGLLPKQKGRISIAAILSVTAGLLSLNYLFTWGSAGWGRYLIVAFAIIQAIVAVVVLLFEAGIITPPVPRPKYEQPQYGYGGPGGYYGQPGQSQQQPYGGYPSPQQPSYGGYPQQQGTSTGGFPAQPAAQQQPGQHSQQSGPPTPPTGFPQYGQPPASPSPAGNNQPTTQVPVTQQLPAAQPASPPQQSGPAPS